MIPSISFCLIACNEESRLEKCINSARDLCSEIVVIDTGSTDDTVTKSESLGATVYHFQWVDDFAAARNFGLTKLSGDWVLMLDADEWLLPESLEAIRQHVADQRCIAINLLRRELNAVQSPWSLVSRLFRRHPDIKFNRPYHGMIDDSLEKLLKVESKWRIHDLHLPAIAHEGYRADEIATQQKAIRARRAMERFYEQHPDDPYVCSKLGSLLLSLNETKRAENLLHHGLRTVGKNPKAEHLLYELNYHLGLLYRRLGRMNKAYSYYQAATRQKIDPRLMVGASFNLAAIDQQSGRLGDAIIQFEKIIKLVPDLPQAYLNLGLAKRANGQLDAAESNYREAISIDPEFADAHRNLGVLLLREGKTSEALEYFAKALACYDKQSPELAEEFRALLKDHGLTSART